MTAFEEGLGALPPDLPVQALVIRGPARRVMVAVVNREVDVLVVGAGRHGPLHRAWYSSIPHHALAHSTCTVITVPPSPLAAEAGRIRSGRRWRRALRDGANGLEDQHHAPAP